MTRKRKISIMYSLFVLLKGCVRYIFASLFCMSKRVLFYFTSKALFLPEIIKCKLFKYSNVMTSSNAQE